MGEERGTEELVYSGNNEKDSQRSILAEGGRAIRRGSTGQEKMRATKEKKNSVEEVRSRPWPE